MSKKKIYLNNILGNHFDFVQSMDWTFNVLVLL
jgi:hypothetical protein